MNKYYFHNGLEEVGPISIDQLKKEQLKKDTPIWYKELKDWVKAEEVDELKHLFENIPPPLKSAIAAPPDFKINNLPIREQEIKPKKKSLSLFIIGGVLSVLIIIGLLTYQNKVQADDLNNVKLKIEQEKQDLIIKEDQKKAETEEKEKLQEIQLQKEKTVKEKEIAEKEKANAALNEKYMGYRNNWQNYIFASESNFSSDALGGITNLSIEVYNSTDKMIDEVQILVGYIKANGAVYKYETVSVTNIGPSSNKAVIAPSSDRGVKVSTKITNVSAKAFHFCFPGGMNGSRNADPYFCK